MSSGSGFRQRARLVLFVEDDPVIRELYGDALKQAGFSVVEAPTLAAARDALELVQPDVIVLDRELPDGDGFDALPSLLSATRAPTIAFTASRDRRAREIALSAGCAMFLEKSCMPSVLVGHVSEILAAPSWQRLRVTGA